MDIIIIDGEYKDKKVIQRTWIEEYDHSGNSFWYEIK